MRQCADRLAEDGSRVVQDFLELYRGLRSLARHKKRPAPQEDRKQGIAAVGIPELKTISVTAAAAASE
jgi:hypothetical protein